MGVEVTLRRSVVVRGGLQREHLGEAEAEDARAADAEEIATGEAVAGVVGETGGNDEHVPSSGGKQVGGGLRVRKDYRPAGQSATKKSPAETDIQDFGSRCPFLRFANARI